MLHLKENFNMWVTNGSYVHGSHPDCSVAGGSVGQMGQQVRTTFNPALIPLSVETNQL